MPKLPYFIPPSQQFLLDKDARNLGNDPTMPFSTLFDQLEARETLVGLFEPAGELEGTDAKTCAPALDELQFEEWMHSVRNGLWRLVNYWAVPSIEVIGYVEVKGKYNGTVDG
jgi:hypothetical protein